MSGSGPRQDGCTCGKAEVMTHLQGCPVAVFRKPDMEAPASTQVPKRAGHGTEPVGLFANASTARPAIEGSVTP